MNFNNKNYTSVSTNKLIDNFKDKGNELKVWKMPKALYGKQKHLICYKRENE